MKFRYSQTLSTRLDGRFKFRPIIKIELIGDKEKIQAFGLIDSGADNIMLNVQYAKALGIKLDKNKKLNFRGIGRGEVETYIALIKYKVEYFPYTISTQVVFIDSENVDILLGQEGFFDYFRVKFEKDNQTFELSIPKNIEKKLKKAK